MTDTAGNLILPPFLYPCPKRCNLTAGCESCRTYQEPKHYKYTENEATPEEEERFYKKVFS